MGKREDAALAARNATRLLERFTIIRELCTLSTIYTEKDEELRIRKEAIYREVDDLVSLLHRRTAK